jgi:hypothetical protein
LLLSVALHVVVTMAVTLVQAIIILPQVREKRVVVMVKYGACPDAAGSGYSGCG